MENTIESKVSYLIELTKKKDIEKIKISIEQENENRVIVNYIKELFKGNNFIVKEDNIEDEDYLMEHSHIRVMFRASEKYVKDYDSYKLELSENNSSVPKTFVKLIISEEPLSIDHIYISYNRLSRYSKLIIISFLGYTDIEKIKFKYKNIQLYDWNDIEILIRNYNSLNVRN